MRVDAIKATARQAHADPDVRRRLFSALLSPDAHVARDAAWAITHMPSSDNIHIADWRDDLAYIAITTDDAPLRRLTLALLDRLDWDADDVRTDLLDFCLNHISDTAEPCGVRALCVKLSYSLCRHWPELLTELGQILQLLRDESLKPGLRNCIQKVRDSINQLDLQ